MRDRIDNLNFQKIIWWFITIDRRRLNNKWNQLIVEPFFPALFLTGWDGSRAISGRASASMIGINRVYLKANRYVDKRNEYPWSTSTWNMLEWRIKMPFRPAVYKERDEEEKKTKFLDKKRRHREGYYYETSVSAYQLSSFENIVHWSLESIWKMNKVTFLSFSWSLFL